MNMLKKTYAFFYRMTKKIWLNSPLISWVYIRIGNSVFSIKSLKIEDIKVNLIVLGAQKSGTSSLHFFLNSHPDIFMSHPMKEPRFFCSERRILDYFSSEEPLSIKNRSHLFFRHMIKGYKGERIFGESSTDYTIKDFSKSQQIPQRIMEMAGKDVKFIYILRNPFDRIISHFLHLERHGRINNNHSLQEEVIRNSSLIENSLYYTQLKPYLEYFSKNKILLIDFNRFTNRDESLSKELAEFLGIDNLFSWQNSHNNRSSNREKYSGQDLMFEGDWFEKTKILFLSEMDSLAREFHFKPNWNFDSDKYVKDQH